MSPDGDSDYSIGQKIETPYGEGVVQSTSREKITVFIRGSGSMSFRRADLEKGAAAQGQASPPQSGPSRAPEVPEETPGSPEPQRKKDPEPRPGPADPPAPPTYEMPAPTLEPVEDGQRTSDAPDKIRRRAAIESLRLGTVPPFAVREATISRQAEVRQIEDVISSVRNRGEGGILLLTGPNGSGKTHLLRLTEQEALDARFLVARSDLEGATKLTPKDVYREAVTSLSWRSDGLERGTLQRFLAEHESDLDDVELGPLAESRVLYYLLARMQDDRDIGPKVWDYIHGSERFAEDLEHTPFKTTWLAFWGTAGQSLGNAMNGLAYLSRALGYAGLALFVDETELLLNQDVDWAIRGREWLRGLVLSALGGSFEGANGFRFREWGTSPYRTWDAWPGQNIQKGRTEWSLRYGGVHPSRDPKSRGDPLPYAPCGEVPFLLALGYTDQPDSDATVFDEGTAFEDSWLPEWVVEEGVLEMEPPDADDVAELIRQTVRLYRAAYPDDASQISSGLSSLSGDLAGLIQARLRTGAASSLRWAVQTLVETLDRVAAGVPAADVRRSLSG